MDTFLVRVWVPADGASVQGGLRGFVRHVATGAETPFRGDEEVLDLRRVGASWYAWHGPGARPDDDDEGDRCSHR